MENINRSVRLKKPLLTNSDGNRIVKPDGFVRVFVWEHYWNFWAKVTEPPGQKKKDVENVLYYIERDYKALIKEIVPLARLYLTDLKATTQNPNDMKNSRIKLQRLFHLFKNIRALKTTPYAFPKPQKALKHLTRIAIFEGHIQISIPGDLFKKILSSEQLEGEDLTLWKEFTAKLKGTNLTIKQLHKTLLSLKAVLSPNTPAEAILELEQKLLEGAPHLFTQKDKEHMAWRDNLKTGDTVGDFELGEELIGEHEEAGKRRVFTLLDKPHLVFVSAVNCVLLPIYLFYQKNYNSGLRCPDCDYIDPEGRFAIFERLPFPVKNLEWESTSKMTSEDKALLTPFINLAKWCIEENMFLSPLDINDLYFDNNDILRSMKLTALTSFNEDKLKQFLKDLSKGNDTILNYIHNEVYLL